jgi:hypothetical protein
MTSLNFGAASPMMRDTDSSAQMRQNAATIRAATRGDSKRYGGLLRPCEDVSHTQGTRCALERNRGQEQSYAGNWVMTE